MKPLLNAWYIGCASLRLKEKPLAAVILDKNLVLFRDQQGKANALQDRCCHRGMKLSQGKIENGNLQCSFHGWQFDGAGKCAHVPSLTSGKEVSGQFKVDSYTCVEKDGYVWIWMGDAAPGVQPSIPEFEKGKWTQGVMELQCEAIRAIDINLDYCHVFFLHPTHPYTQIAKQRGFRDTQIELRMTENGFVTCSEVTKSETEPMPAKAGKIYFELPDQVKLENDVPGFGMVYIFIFAVPIGEKTCRLEYMMSQFRPSENKVEWMDQVPAIFLEDKLVLEEIQKTYDREGDSFEKTVAGDAPGMMLRQVLKLASEGKWNEGKSKLAQRKIVDVRM